MEFSKDQTDNYINSIKKISTGIPIQYITNNQEFMNLNFYVDENVLIPQPDTETLVEEVINEYKEKKCEILDLCTGSGAIAISLAKYINESNNTIQDNKIILSTDEINNKKISLKDSINAPISKGDVIGNVEFTLNDQTIATTPIISDTDIPKLNLITMSTSILKNWFKLLR